MKQKYRCVGDVRYKGLFSALELVKDKSTREPLAPFNGSSPEMAKLAGHLKSNHLYAFSRFNMLWFARTHHQRRGTSPRSGHRGRSAGGCGCHAVSSFRRTACGALAESRKYIQLLDCRAHERGSWIWHNPRNIGLGCRAVPTPSVNWRLKIVRSRKNFVRRA